MPLELSYLPEGGAEEQQYHLVMPGEGICFDDYYSDEPEKVALVCDPEDEGGNFLVLMDTPPSGETTELPESKENITIVRGGEYTRPFANAKGDEATMIIRHVGYASVQFSKLASPN